MILVQTKNNKLIYPCKKVVFEPLITLVMREVGMGTSRNEYFDGTPCAMKVACTVWTGGKVGDNIKGLPIGIHKGKSNNDLCDKYIVNRLVVHNESIK